MNLVNNERFDAKLVEILNGMKASELLSIAGIYELVSEEFNNEVLQSIEEEDDEDGLPVQPTNYGIK